MKLLYITAHTPYGRGETFILEEMRAIVKLGADLVIAPRSPSREVFHEKAKELLDRTIWLPLLSWRFFLSFLLALFVKPKLCKVLAKVLSESRSLRILLKNLAVLPKAIFLSWLVQKKGINHIYAHWGSTTATIAWAISELTGVPWSFTVHRWDIAENNMLRLKTEKASFVRCISKDGLRELLEIIGEDLTYKVKLLHMGVWIPEKVSFGMTREGLFVFACPANLVPKKGHRYLIEACFLLKTRGFTDFRCLIIGDGPLEAELRKQVQESGLEGLVEFTGRIPHDELLRMYARREIDVVVLPSIVTEDGEREGIPVSLMEAMAYGVPVIATQTGGIPELVEGAGILVPPGSAESLAEAILRLARDRNLRTELGRKGYEKVRLEFNTEAIVCELLNLMEPTNKGVKE